MRRTGDLRQSLKRFINSQGFRFLFFSAANTVATYLLYLVLILVIDYQSAYSITYVIGVVLGYFLNSLFVFGVMPNFRTLLSYPLAYIVHYLCGISLLSIFVGVFGFDDRFAPLLVLVVVTPIAFVLNRFVFNSKAS